LSQRSDSSEAWVDLVKRGLEDLASPDHGREPTSINAQTLAFIHRVDERYRRNYDLESSEQLPLAVFERFVEMLASVAEAAATHVLYQEIHDLSNEIFGKTTILDVVRARLREALDTQIEADPHNAEAYLQRGKLSFDDRETDAAKLDFAAALRLNPGIVEARHRQLLVLLQEREDEQALAQLNELLGLEPADPFGLLQRARLWMRYFYIAEAIGDLTRLVSATDDRSTLLYAAKQFLYTGDAELASMTSARIGEDAEAKLILGKAQLERGDLEASIIALESALTLTRGKESLQQFASIKVSALKLRGDVYARQQQNAQALDCYLEAMASTGFSYELRRELARIAWHSVAKDHDFSMDALARIRIEAKWIEPNMEADFEDGVPVEVRSDDLQLAPYLERLPWTTTVQRISISAGRRDNREALVQLFQIELPRLRGLQIEAEYFGFPCLYRLVAAPFFSRIEDLTLWGCDLDFPSMCLLLTRVPQGLRALHILGADARPKLPRSVTLVDLARGWQCPMLHTLELTSCSLSVEEIMALTEANLPKLETLILTGNDLSELDVEIFLDTPLVQQLHEIRFGDSGAEAALLRGIFAKLDRLKVRRVWAQRAWTPEELEAVGADPAARRLEQLELGVGAISEESWLALLETPPAR
jgi:tetratricopeptide (TPR) repeat protein